MVSCLVLFEAEGAVAEGHAACAMEMLVFADAVDLELVCALQAVRVVPTADVVGLLKSNGNVVIIAFSCFCGSPCCCFGLCR